MLCILEKKEYSEIKIKELYEETHSKFQNVDEFIYSLDVLFILDQIDVNFEKETIKYVNRNQV
jgi:hypothetical protein